MRKFTGLVLLVAALVLVPVGSAGAAGSAQCAYIEFSDGGGCLVISHAAGSPFMARDSAGMIVAQGVSAGESFGVSIPPFAVAPLLVNVAGQLFFVNAREDMWQ